MDKKKIATDFCMRMINQKKLNYFNDLVSVFMAGMDWDEPEQEFATRIHEPIPDYVVKGLDGFTKARGYYPSDTNRSRERSKIMAINFYNEYKAWTSENMEFTFSIVRFGRKLAELGFEKERNMYGWSYIIYKDVEGKI